MVPTLVFSPRGIASPSRPDLAGIRILLLVPHRGAVAQEVLDPLAVLKDHGAQVVVATLEPQPIHLEPVGRLIALVENFWRPTWRHLARARREGWLQDPVVIPYLGDDLERWLAGFDAVVVPGGFGRHYARFVQDPWLHRCLTGLYEKGRWVALECHSVLAGALARRSDGPALLAGRHVTCWPAFAELSLGLIPLLGRYFMPFGRPVELGVRRVVEAVHFGVPGPNPHVVVDGHLVTSWGPWSAHALGTTLVQLLSAMRPVVVLN